MSQEAEGKKTRHVLALFGATPHLASDQPGRRSPFTTSMPTLTSTLRS
jgi:hypothetical protein